MLLPHLKNFHLEEWIEANKKDWPERGVRVIMESEDYITMVIRGPTRGKEFHVAPGEEIFYQLQGELHFQHMDNGERKVMVVRPGEMFLLPGNIPHSPRRPDESSWTLVVERTRRPEEKDWWVWYCERCNHKLYESAPRPGAGPTSRGPNTFIQEANRTLREDGKLRSCSQCGEELPAPA